MNSPSPIYPDLELAWPSVPPRSRLFALEPIGLGTALVESLTSYVIRLAEAHSVWPKTLVEREILPQFGRAYLLGGNSQNRTTFWGQSTYMLNGMQGWSQDWSTILNGLTQRQDLGWLTLQHWREVLSSGALLRRQRAWCPACYAGWAASGTAVYEPLLWMVQAVTVCPVHRQPLMSSCPACQRPMSVLAQRSQVGRCARCAAWLGQEPPPLPQAEAAAVWAAEAVGAVLAAGSAGQESPPRSQIAMVFGHYATQMGASGLCGLARRIGEAPRTVLSWRQGTKLPQLGTLVRICARLRVAPVAVLTDPEASVVAHRLAPEVLEEPAHWRKWRKQPTQQGWVEEVRVRLETVVAEEAQPPPTLGEVALRVGYSTNSLRRHFPELCQLLVARQGRQRRLVDRQALQAALEGVLADPREPPPSLCEVGRQLEYHHSHLCHYFPELCRAITTRLRAYHQAERERRQVQRGEAVRRAVQELHAQGRYPSSSAVNEALADPHALRDVHVREIWRATLRELGWDEA